MLFCIGIAADLHANPITQTAERAASSSCDTLTREQEQQFMYYYYEAQRLILSDQIIEARPLVEFCHALHPNNATVNHLMGHYAQMDEDHISMAKFYQKAFQLSPEEYWYNYNILLLRMDIPKMNALAVRNLEVVSQTLRNDDNLYALLQQAYIKCAKYDQALAVQDQRDSINGYNEESAMFRYQFHMALDNTQLAIQEVERYLELDPSHIEFLQIRAGLYEVTQQPTHKLIEAYEALLPYDQNNAGLLNNLAWALCISNRDLQRAERLSMMAVLSEPSNTTFLDTYAWIAYQLGDCEAALFFIDKAVENMTDENTTAEGKKEIKNHYKIIHKRCK